MQRIFLKSPLSRQARRLVWLLCFAGGFSSGAWAAAEAANRGFSGEGCLVVVLDGLRPDYITPELMPNLHRFGEEGIMARQHHVAFPPHTRVNATTLATGTNPGTHGILSNALYIPELGRHVDTANAGQLVSADEALGGGLVGAKTLGEILEEEGRDLLAVSSGSTGSALLLNPRVRGRGVVNARGMVRRPGGDESAEWDFPRRTRPNIDQNRWAVERLLDELRGETLPAVSFLWISDPDNTQHVAGVGAPRTLEALRHADEVLGELLAALVEEGLRDRINIFVTTDHGFSTHTGGFDAPGALGEAGLAEGLTFCAYGEQIFLDEPDEDRLRSIVEVLREKEEVGAIFSRPSHPGSPEGTVPGTLSFDLMNWNHPRAPDLMVTAAWTDEVNEHGYAGKSTFRGVAGHNTPASHEMLVWLFGAGPDLKSGVWSEAPTGNVDLAATCLYLLGIPGGDRMDGRVLIELIRGGPGPGDVEVERENIRFPANGENGFSAVFQSVEVEGIRYPAAGRKNPTD